MKKLFGGAAAFALASVSLASDIDNYRGYIGVRAGASFFVNGDMRDYFGSGKLTFGITPVTTRSPRDWAIDTDLDLQIANQNGNRLLMIPVTVGIGKTFGDKNNGSRPYMALRAGAAYLDYAITNKSAVRLNERRIVPTANAEIGVIFSERLKLAARYDYFGRTNGLTFDGFQVNLSYGFFKF